MSLAEELIRRQIESWWAEKRACKRWSTGWHRADAAIVALEDLKRRLRKGVV